MSSKEKVKAGVPSPERVRPRLSTYSGPLELLDPEPLAKPVGFRRPIPISERVRRMVRSELLARELGSHEVETFEDADDFDIPDDPVDRSTPYEDSFDPQTPGIAAREAEIRAGAVMDRPAERKHRARETLAEFRKRRVAHGSFGPTSEGGSGNSVLEGEAGRSRKAD